MGSSRKGKGLDVTQDLEDAERFEKVKRLAQVWHEANMSKIEKEESIEGINSLFNWMRKRNKNFDIDVVSDPKVDDICKLFTAWGGKKNRKSKLVAHEIEEALDWWSRNDYELDEEASPAKEEKMKRLESLAQCWYQLAYPDSTPGSGLVP